MAALSAYAGKPYATDRFDVNGIEIGAMVSDSLLVDKLGRPIEVEDSGGFVSYSYGDVEKVKSKIRNNTSSTIIDTRKGFIVGGWEDKISFGVANGKITSISYCDPDLGI